MAFYHRVMNRDETPYKRNHYRAHWQPLWAYLGLLLCSLLMLFSGWAAIYDLVRRSEGVKRQDSVVDLIAAYLGVGLAPLVQQQAHILTSFSAYLIFQYIRPVQMEVQYSHSKYQRTERRMVSCRCTRRG